MKRFGKVLLIVNLIGFIVALIHHDVYALILFFQGEIWGLFFALGGKL